MWKSALAGALALAATGSVLAPTTTHADGVRMVSQQQHGKRLLSEAKISGFKAALKLRPDQERHWPAVAAELRRLRRVARASTSFVHGFANRAGSEVVGLRRLVSAAMPLFATLDGRQKRVAMRIVTAMGFGSFVAAL